MAWLRKKGRRTVRDGMARYALPSDRAFGVPVGVLRKEATRLGRDHALAAALWETGWFEARIMAALVDEPERVTARQMDAWARDCDNWGITDTACFHLFDKTPLAWDRVPRWAASPHEFVKRGAFALAASLALHDRTSPDARFVALLPLVEKAAADDRNFVKKGVSWALRGIGRRSPGLHEAALAVARRLAASDAPAARWVGRDALRDLSRAKARARPSR